MMLVYDFCSIGYGVPIFHKIGDTREFDYLRIRGARDTIQGKLPETWMILAKNAGCFLLMLLAPPELIALIQNVKAIRD